MLSIADTDMVINQQLHAFLCTEQINNFFLMFILSFQKNYMISMASNTTVPYMNKTICNGIPIFRPPIGLQREFAKRVEKVESLKAKLKASQLQAEEQFKALSQRAFAGEL